VYEFSRNFRNEGMDRTHNPEFTVLEFYTAYKDYEWMMSITEQLMEKIAMGVNGTTKTIVGDVEIDFKSPYQRISIYDAIKQHTAFEVSEMDEDELRQVCRQLHLKSDASMGKGKLVDEIFGEKCEQHYVPAHFHY
jgi:lysyl-tRNA synthetase class 2